jgi:hypothetical protein
MSATASLTVAEAMDQLNQSERGRAAARAFLAFLDANNGSAYSLDTNNWRAIASLARACSIHGAYSVATALKEEGVR